MPKEKAHEINLTNKGNLSGPLLHIPWSAFHKPSPQHMLCFVGQSFMSYCISCIWYTIDSIISSQYLVGKTTSFISRTVLRDLLTCTNSYTVLIIVSISSPRALKNLPKEKAHKINLTNKGNLSGPLFHIPWSAFHKPSPQHMLYFVGQSFMSCCISCIWYIIDSIISSQYLVGKTTSFISHTVLRDLLTCTNSYTVLIIMSISSPPAL